MSPPLNTGDDDNVDLYLYFIKLYCFFRSKPKWSPCWCVGTDICPHGNRRNDFIWPTGRTRHRPIAPYGTGKQIGIPMKTGSWRQWRGALVSKSVRHQPMAHCWSSICKFDLTKIAQKSQTTCYIYRHFTFVYIGYAGCRVAIFCQQKMTIIIWKVAQKSPNT